MVRGLVPPDWGWPLRLRVNDGSLSPGETLTLTVTTLPESTPMVVDLYVALQLPDQQVWFLSRDGSLRPAIQPYVDQWPVMPFRGELFRYTLTGAELPGNYVWLAAFIDPGTGMIIGTMAQAPFTRQSLGHATQRYPLPRSSYGAHVAVSTSAHRETGRTTWALRSRGWHGSRSSSGRSSPLCRSWLPARSPSRVRRSTQPTQKGGPSTVSSPTQHAPSMKRAPCLSARRQLAATDQPRIRDGMVGRATRAGRDPRRAVAGQAGDAVNPRGLRWASARVITGRMVVSRQASIPVTRQTPVHVSSAGRRGRVVWV